MQRAFRNPVPFVAAAVLVAGAALSVRSAHASICGTQDDFLARSEPLMGEVRPADCATLLGAAPDFSWPMQDGRNTYTVALTFPDGHTETRTTSRNWLAWDRPVPPGGYAWRIGVNGQSRGQSAPRTFRVDRGGAEALGAAALSNGQGGEEGRAEAAGTSAPGLFRFEPTETWIPSPLAAHRASRAHTGRISGSFTE